MLQKLSNVKLRLDFFEVWSFYRHSDFTWNQILVSANGPKMSFLAILETHNFEFGNFLTWKFLKFTQIKIKNLKNFQKQHYWTVWIRQNVISRKIWVTIKS